MIIVFENQYGLLAYNMEYLLRINVCVSTWKSTGGLDEDGEEIREPSSYEIQFVFNSNSIPRWEIDGVNEGFEKMSIPGFRTYDDAKKLLDIIFESYEKGKKIENITPCVKKIKHTPTAMAVPRSCMG